ncbi:dTDP-4-dehydrorhamnose reductase [Tenacibaculum agarivorans]|uniref:dTDP-4-dehydrorhamnose reductase n=1 Tax=Tenacibaculum agarivorans TaxID=1908389 RepID=UPI00094B7EE3|nr:dTDP-4-dehydrorhamnose reductase [Tenacibaculum agarivorans]
MRVLVTGASGQLGSEIKSLSKKFTHNEFFFEDSKGLDITDSKRVDAYIADNNIDTVINCAAYTSVDKAESEEETAERVNGEAVKNLVQSLSKKKGKLIHISTDYVFNGKSYIPYKENDEVDPIGVYGKTKRKGEEYLLNSEIEGVIIRTSWVYSSFGNNFVKTMLKLGEDRNELNVIFDQVGSPTYAKDLGELCLNLLDKDFNTDSKIYHYSNEGVLSWFDFAKAIMEISGKTCEVYPIETKDYPTPAKRPNFSLLNKSKIKKDFGIEIPYWRDSLKMCINEIES